MRYRVVQRHFQPSPLGWLALHLVWNLESPGALRLALESHLVLHMFSIINLSQEIDYQDTMILQQITTT
jgi:hypothetical protein